MGRPFSRAVALYRTMQSRPGRNAANYRGRDRNVAAMAGATFARMRIAGTITTRAMSANVVRIGGYSLQANPLISEKPNMMPPPLLRRGGFPVARLSLCHEGNHGANGNECYQHGKRDQHERRKSIRSRGEFVPAGRTSPVVNDAIKNPNGEPYPAQKERDKGV